MATNVPAFPIGICTAAWYRDPAALIERFVERAGPLYAVIEGTDRYHDDTQILGGQPSGDYRVIFSAKVAGRMLGYVAVVQHGRVTNLVMGCMSLEDSLLQWAEHPPPIITRGPAFVEPQPKPTPTPASDPADAPRGFHTGYPALNRIIDALAGHDSSSIEQVIRTTWLQCTHNPRLGSRPQCHEDELEGTIVEALGGIGWSRASVSEIAEVLATRAMELYAVTGDDHPDGQHSLIYKSDDPNRLDAAIFIDGAAITGYVDLKHSNAEQWANWSHVILRGPAWPQDAQ